MSITARDIQEQGFEHSRKGYDIEEVDIFLERVATEVDALTHQNQELRARLAEMAEQRAIAPAVESDSSVDGSAQLAEYEQRIAEYERRIAAYDARVEDLNRRLEEKGEDANAISAAIISAQKSADSIREEARVEGEKIYREAENKAREIVRDALSDKQQTLTELDQLKKSRDDFRQEYQQMLTRFAKEADREFAALSASESGPMLAEQVAAEERQAIDDMRAKASRHAPRQEAMLVNDAPAKPAYPTPAAATTQMPPVHRDISSFGDTADDDLDIEEID